MPRQANGTYLPPANTAAVTNTAISSTAYNTLETDIGTEITNSVDRLGRSAMQASLPMGTNKITGMAEPTVATDAATKNYVDTATATFFSTGDVKLTIKNTPDSGWLMFDDGTFGSASSGSSNYNNANAQALFTLFFQVMVDTAAPLFTSGGGATTRAAQVSASAAWAANCRMSLPKTLGRALGVSGAGSGLTSRGLGEIAGNQTITIGQANLPSVLFSGTIRAFGTGNFTNATAINFAGATGFVYDGAGLTETSSKAIVVNSGGSGTPVTAIPPTSYLNAMVKL